MFDEDGVAYATSRSRRCRRGPASSNISISRGPIPSSAAAPSTTCARRMARSSRARAPADADVVVPVPDSGVPAAIGYCAGLRHSLRARHHPQPLCRPHLHRADAAHPRARRAAEAHRQPRRGRRQAHRAGRRLHRARHHLDQDRADDARRRRQGGAFPHRLAADHASRLLRHRHARSATSCSPRHTRLEEMRQFIGADSLAFLSVDGIYRAMGYETPRSGAAAIHRSLLHRRLSDAAHRPAPPRRTGRGNCRCSPRRAEARAKRNSALNP